VLPFVLFFITVSYFFTYVFPCVCKPPLFFFLAADIPHQNVQQQNFERASYLFTTSLV